jgi:hypothetical protein
MTFDELIAPLTRSDFLDRFRQGACFFIKGEPDRFRSEIRGQYPLTHHRLHNQFEDTQLHRHNQFEDTQLHRPGNRSPNAWISLA